MPVNTARIVVGRLLEIRAAAGYRTIGEVQALFEQIGQAIANLPLESKHVTVVDWRYCPVMAPEAADFLAAQMLSTNPGTERSAALARTDSPVAVLQFVRMIRDAGFADRRLLFDEVELCSWLGEVLVPAEAERLRAFLRERPEP